MYEEEISLTLKLRTRMKKQDIINILNTEEGLVMSPTMKEQIAYRIMALKTQDNVSSSSEMIDNSKNSETPLRVVKKYLKDHFHEGVECPACWQNVKLYPRNITSAMAYGLILLVNSGKTEFFHIEDFLKEQNCSSSIRGDIAKLRHFGLLERLAVKRKDGSSRAGYYKVTDKARQFVLGQVTVAKGVSIFNNTVYGYDKEQINIVDALDNKFNYNELMGR